MSVRKLNPNHPVIQETEEHWHKFCALLMAKFSPTAPVEFTSADVEALGNDKAVMLDARNNRLVLHLLPLDVAEKLAREAGGLLQ